jgi:hypothetical protein
MTDLTYQKMQKKTPVFFCEICAFKCSNKYNYNKHISTRKHEILTNSQKKMQKNATSLFVCECGAEYKHKQSLYNHKKKCRNQNLESKKIESNQETDNLHDIQCEESTKTCKISNDLILKLLIENNDIKQTLIKENQELKNHIEHQSRQIDELIPRIGNNNNNTFKQKFNINMFLNDRCKDAINIDEFIKSIQISVQQLDFIKNEGIEIGISNVILDNINKLGVYKRPLHCTDTKREIIYIKDQNEWERDNDKTKIKKAIRDVSDKQYSALKEWIDENPDYQEVENKQDYFVKTLSIIGENTKTIDEKVIKKLCNNTYIK